MLETRRCKSLEILLLAGFGWVSDGAENVVMSYMLPALEEIWGLTHAEQGAMMTAIMFGQVLGAAFWGALADAVGRRRAFLLSLLATSAFGVASAFSGGFYTYCVLRLITGFAIGGNLPLAVSVASELLQPSWRERGVVALQLFNDIGSLGSTGLAALLLPSSWQLYLLLVSVPALAVFIVALFRLPESPHWLISQGRHEEAAAVLGGGIDLGSSSSGNGGGSGGGSGDDGGGGGGDDAALEAVEDERRSLEPGPDEAADDQQRCRLVRQLCGAKLWSATATMGALWFSANFGSGWWSWMPEFAHLQGLDSGTMYLSATVARFIAMGSFLLAILLIRGVGAWRLLICALAGTGAMSYVLAVVVSRRELLASSAFVPLYGVFALFFGVTWPVMYVVTPAAFPSEVRGAGFGLVSAFSKLGGLTQPNVVALLLPPSAPPPPPAAPPQPSGGAPPSPPPARFMYLIGVVFTAAWAVALAAALIQAWRERRAARRGAPAVDEQFDAATSPEVAG